MAYPAYLRERARELRTTKHLSLDEIAERLALPKTTVYCWIVDLPLGRPRRENGHKGNLAMQAKYRRLREDAYAQGWAEYDELVNVPTFRGFVSLYIAEGFKRDRNRVSIADSDERVIGLAVSWMRRFTTKRLTYSIQYHADQVLAELRDYWAAFLASTVRRSDSSESQIAASWRAGLGDASMAF
jgi:transcriptional regulator with XRE-family HTH domain